MQKTQGFTLVEMLVVVAIVGILAGMVVVSMSSSENSAEDARVKSGMDQIRTQSIIKEKDTADYSDMNCSDADISALCTDVNAHANAGINLFRDATAANGVINSNFCAYVQMKGGNYMCIASKGTAYTELSSVPTNCTQALCNTSDAVNNCTCN